MLRGSVAARTSMRCRPPYSRLPTSFRCAGSPTCLAYLVQQNDSVASIAQSLGISATQLQQLNKQRIPSTGVPTPGTYLLLPGWVSREGTGRKSGLCRAVSRPTGWSSGAQRARPAPQCVCRYFKKVHTRLEQDAKTCQSPETAVTECQVGQGGPPRVLSAKRAPLPPLQRNGESQWCRLCPLAP